MPKLRLLLGDDHTLMRQGLRKILEERPEWEVIAEVGDGREAVKKCLALKPDVAVLDVAMPLLNGIDATQQMHPATLDDLGLVAAIDSSLRGLARRQDIRAELHPTDLPERLPREVELAAYRIVQEAINNVSKHANASEVHVHLTHLKDRLLIEVEDDGVGFVEDTDRPIIARGLGLISVRERAARLGGTFNILSTPGEGTRLVVSLPERGALV